jgi:hypothetical protein
MFGSKSDKPKPKKTVKRQEPGRVYTGRRPTQPRDPNSPPPVQGRNPNA